MMCLSVCRNPIEFLPATAQIFVTIRRPSDPTLIGVGRE